MSGGAGRSGATTFLLSGLLLAIGLVMVARTLSSGGGALSLGVVLGGLFVAAGAARLWLAWRMR
jgi:CBS-domain-containing membrane protein